MSNNCNLDYNEIFTKQLFQTLGQLVAALMTTSLAVPVISFYTRGYMFYNKPNKPNNTNVPPFNVNEASDNEASDTVSVNEASDNEADNEASDNEADNEASEYERNQQYIIDNFLMK